MKQAAWPMKILIVSPAPARSRHGNRVTALRWARILRRLGHRVDVRNRYEGGRWDLLVALHARKSAASVEAFRRTGRPIVVALTGTDVYRDIHRSGRARRALHAAARLVVLQPLAVRELAVALRSRARVIHQSAESPSGRPRPARDRFDVCVIGHLRPEKDPFRAAAAVRRLPASSTIRVLHVGKAMTNAMARRARGEMMRNPRYRWLGERPRAEARAILARSRLMVLSSRMEGGANVVSEALAASVPIVASRIPGTVGLLGGDYAGFFRTGDTAALTALLERAERDRRFVMNLQKACGRRRSLVSVRREERSWRELLASLRRRRR